MSGEGTEVGIHEGVGGALSGDDNVIGEPDAETGAYAGVGCVGQVICIYPYVPLNHSSLSTIRRIGHTIKQDCQSWGFGHLYSDGQHRLYGLGL